MVDTNTALSQTSQFWRDFYARHSLRHDPSPFAHWCLENHLRADNHILELGCGCGRDSFAFLHHGLSVLAIDGCKVAITDNLAHLQTLQVNVKGHFHTSDFGCLSELHDLAAKPLVGINTVYSRFVLHAIPESLEDLLLDFCHQILPVGGRMLHEFRTIRDPLMQKGQVLSANERMTDHYRRFLDPDVFRSKLAALGWKETYFVESGGLAKFGNDDPMVARVIIEKMDLIGQ